MGEFLLGAAFTGGAVWMVASVRRRKKPQAVRSGLVMEPEKPSKHIDLLEQYQDLVVSIQSATPSEPFDPVECECGLVFTDKGQHDEHFENTAHRVKGDTRKRFDLDTSHRVLRAEEAIITERGVECKE